jgi:DNA-directed RNA polymerase beta subunit
MLTSRSLAAKICKSNSKSTIVGDEEVNALDIDGIIPPGTQVDSEDILVGKVLHPSNLL